MRRVVPAFALALAFGASPIAAASGTATVRPSAASTCFRASHWHAAVQTFPTSRNLTAMGRFYRGAVPVVNGWWVHFYANRADLEYERAQLRKGLAAPFVAVMVRRGNDLIGWQGPDLPTPSDTRLRDRCFPA